MTKRFYEDFDVGDTAESSVARTISEADVYTQAGLSGSYNPIHTDREYMADTPFGRRLVQNTLLITVMGGLHRRQPWDPALIAAYGREDIRFTNPVFIDDTVRLESEIVEKRPRDEESGIVTSNQELYNQDDDLVATGKYLMLVRRA